MSNTSVKVKLVLFNQDKDKVALIKDRTVELPVTNIWIAEDYLSAAKRLASDVTGLVTVTPKLVRHEAVGGVMFTGNCYIMTDCISNMGLALPYYWVDVKDIIPRTNVNASYCYMCGHIQESLEVLDTPFSYTPE
ncbi:MAG: hypothetical protein NC548_11120 [Lachnospiraceae bacterium]|nr:hypothetical protein [Lachnospiraceae bacterium]